MEQEQQSAELLPLQSIRTETVLSRFPIHRLARRGSINIEIKEPTDSGEVKTTWEVDYPKKLGQPGPLAYKLDTLTSTGDRGDRATCLSAQARKLSEICRELGVRRAARHERGKSLAAECRGLHHRKGNLPGADAAADSRISDTGRLVFTGEQFPMGRRATAFTIRCRAREILNTRNAPFDDGTCVNCRRRAATI